MRTKICVVFMLLSTLGTGIKGEIPWKKAGILAATPSDTVYLWLKYDNLYYNVDNLVKVTSWIHKPITLHFNKGKITQVNDSIFRLHPTIKGSCHITMQGTMGCILQNVVNLPEPEFYFEGIPSRKYFDGKDSLKGVLMSDLIKHHRVVAQFGDYKYKVASMSVKTTETHSYEFLDSNELSASYMQEIQDPKRLRLSASYS